MAKTALFEARKCPNLNCISIMMSFLTYIMGFFMNFELLPILTDYANLVMAAILDTGRL
jgi:glutaredoxin-related protein